MEVVGGNTLLPGDPRLIDHIVCELKSQGIFDQFRKECIADVDTKPAYQNLRQRVEGSVTGFLKTQNWKPDMNKNQLREMLRKNIYESGFLETGVERIVDQVVNPKINTVFLPQVEEVVYKFLGLAKPTRNSTYNPSSNGALTVNTVDLLPTDLDPISPDSEVLNKSDKNAEDAEAANLDDSKNDEFESPPFEPINEQTVYEPPPHDESSNDSRISGISGLTSHDSNMSDEKPNINNTVPDVNNQDSQLSKVSSNSRLSIVTTDSKHTPEKMDISDDNTEDSMPKIEENASLIGVENSVIKEEIRDELEEIRKEINGHNQNKESGSVSVSEVQDVVKMEVKEEISNSDVKMVIDEVSPVIVSDNQEISTKEEVTLKQDVVKEEITLKDVVIKEEITLKDVVVKEEITLKDVVVKEEITLKDVVVKEETTIKEETIAKEEVKVEETKTESKKSDRHRHDSEKRKDKHSDNNKDRKDEKKSSDKDKKYKSSSSSRDKDRHREKSRDSKSSKDKDGKSNDDKNKDKSKDKSKSSSSTSKHSSRDRNRSSSKSESKSSRDSRDHSKSKDSKSKSDESKSKSDESKSKKSDSSSKSRSRDHSKSDSSKHSSSHTSKDRSKSSSSKDYKKDPKKSSNKRDQDDHSSSRDKKTDSRRSADRDSNDGSSGVNNTSNSTKEKESSASTSSNKSKSDNSDFSGSNSGDSGQSDNFQSVQESNITTAPLKVDITLDEVALNPSNVQTNPPLQQQMKMKKPKIASNIFEVRKLMKIRKRMEKLEKKRQRQQELADEGKNMRSNTESPNSVEDTDSVDSGSLLSAPNNLDELVKNMASITGEDIVEKKENTTAIVSKESWDAIEAKLSQSAHENVDFNLYAEDTGDSSSNSKIEDSSSKRSKRMSEEEDCLYFSNEVSPTTERFLQSIETFQKNSLLDSPQTLKSKRAKKLNNINNDSEIYSDVSPKKKTIKPKKRKFDGEIDTENNNKKVNAIGEIPDISDNLTASPSGSNLSNGSVEKSKSRAKKPKKTVNSSPSSDIDSENLNETKSRYSRASVLKNQRYSSDDLYKPRPIVSGSSRRQRGLLNNTDKKN